MKFLKQVWSPQWIQDSRQQRVFLLHRSLLLLVLLSFVAVSINYMTSNYSLLGVLYPISLGALLINLQLSKKVDQTSILTFFNLSLLVSFIPLIRDSGIFPSYYIWVVIATWFGVQILPARLRLFSSLPLMPTIIYPTLQAMGVYNPTHLIYDIGAPTQIVHNLFGFGIGFFLFISSQINEKENQRRFTRSRNMYQSLLDALPDLIFVQNIKTGVFIDFHSSKEATILSPAQFLGKSHQEVMPPFLVKKIDQAMHDVKSTSKPANFDYYLEADGDVHFYQARVVLMDKDHTISVIRNVTELEVAKRNAESNARSRSLFLSTMSHEIRTPLNGILSMSHLLLDESPTPEQKEMLGTLNFSSEHLLTIVNDILDFSKIDAGMMTLDPRPEDLKKITQNLINIFKPKADENGSQILLEYSDDTFQSFNFDAPRLSQILANLVSNAIKFTQHGKIKLSIQATQNSEKHQTLEFSIKDTGIGISQETQKKIFTPFTQATTSTSRNFGGTGLGISISSQLLKIMNSELKLKSEEGKGSEFYFSLQLPKAVTQNKDSSSKIQMPKVEIGHLKILMAEDNFINQKVVKKVLSKWDITPIITNNGKEALDLIKQGNYEFDIILMDLHMPVMDGFIATHQIRESGYKGPIWALSADVIEGTTEKLSTLGFNGIILKPFKPNELLKVLSSIATQ